MTLESAFLPALWFGSFLESLTDRRESKYRLANDRDYLQFCQGLIRAGRIVLDYASPFAIDVSFP